MPVEFCLSKILCCAIVVFGLRLELRERSIGNCDKLGNDGVQSPELLRNGADPHPGSIHSGTYPTAFHLNEDKLFSHSYDGSDWVI